MNRRIKFDKNPIANLIRFIILFVAAGFFILKIDLTKLIFKKSVEELKAPNITETMSKEQYAEVLKIYRTPEVINVPEIQPTINNEKETALKVYENNSVYVPVTIGYRGKMVTVELLIDTGATGITISPAVAQRLGINSEDTTQGRSTVADGRTVAHYSVNAAFVAVGPKVKKPIQINIMQRINSEDYGLLGMSFLAEFPHMLDMKANVIRWM